MLFLRKILLSLALLLVLSACGGEAEPALPATGTLARYATQTPIPSQTPPFSGEPTLQALPTSTPMVYTIQDGDTFSSLELRFGISVADIMAANPGVSSNALVIGATIFLPSDSQISASSEATPTPASVQISQANCTPIISGGMWCFALLENANAQTLENITARFILRDASAEMLASQVVPTAGNIALPAQFIPLAVYFPENYAKPFTVQVEILTATMLMPSDTRYLPAEARNVTISVDWNGRSGQVEGRAALLKEGGSAQRVLLVAVVYSPEGHLVGVRSVTLEQELRFGSDIPFSMDISSLGGTIGRVDVFVEAGP